MENKAPKGLGNRMKNALFVQKFDLGDTVDVKKKKKLPANNNRDPALEKTRLADGRTGKKLTGESAMPKTKKKLLQCHNNLINKQTNKQTIGICNLNLRCQQKQRGLRPGR